MRDSFYGMNKTPLVLNVDEDPDLLHATSRLLKNAGHEVMEAETGSKGLKKARNTIRI